MKSNKGISLISLIIYLIVLTILVGITAGFTRYFYRNSDEAESTVEISKQYINVIEYLVEDVNSGVVDYIDVKVEEYTGNGGSTRSRKNLYFYLNNGTVHQYFWDETIKKIYYLEYANSLDKKQQYVLCEEVNACDFIKDATDESIFKIELTVGDAIYKNTFKIK